MLQFKIPHWSHKCPQARPGWSFFCFIAFASRIYCSLQEPPNLIDSEGAPDLPARPTTAAKSPTPPPAAPAADEVDIGEQARLLKQYEDQQAALRAQQEAEELRRQELERQQQLEFEQRQREQQERERLALEQLQQQQLYQLNNQAAQRVNELERELLGARGQFERDQLLLEQYDRVCLSSIFHVHLLTAFFRESRLSRGN